MGKIKNFLRLIVRIQDINILDSLRYKRQIVVYKKALVAIHPACKIDISKLQSLHIGHPWENYRHILYKTVFVTFPGSCIELTGDQVLIATGGIFRIGGELILGNVKFNSFCTLYCGMRIEIGDGTIIGSNTVIRDYDAHTLEYPGKESKRTAPIIIKENVWIGLNVTILKGVTIGEGSVIAAGSVVVKNIPPRCLAGGNPAKVIRENVKWDYR